MKPYKLLLFLFFLVANFFSLAGQNSSADFTMPTIISVSPEAKGIVRDIPVNKYIGTPDTSNSIL